MTQSTLSGGIVDFWSGFIKRLRVFHQSFGHIFGFSSFSAKLFISAFFDLRISHVTLKEKYKYNSGRTGRRSGVDRL